MHAHIHERCRHRGGVYHPHCDMGMGSSIPMEEKKTLSMQKVEFGRREAQQQWRPGRLQMMAQSVDCSCYICNLKRTERLEATATASEQVAGAESSRPLRKLSAALFFKQMFVPKS
jgi:hypothetical protein